MANDKKLNMDKTPDANPDPLTGEPGAHPFGVAGGGTGGAMAGAAVGGAIGGPIGAAVGGAIGAVAGGLGGKAAAEAVNPTVEGAYWQKEHSTRSYARKDQPYEYYEPAYRYGWESASRPEFTNRSFESVEPDLERGWGTYRGPSTTEWRDVRDATRESYERIRTGAHRKADYAGDKADGMWDQIKGNWHQFKGGVKSKWNDLTDDDLDQMAGDRERIIGKIQERYGEAKWKRADIENELRGMGRY
jgi:uncharacterized protein YjbJ (UPF0337 family)